MKGEPIGSYNRSFLFELLCNPSNFTHNFYYVCLAENYFWHGCSSTAVLSRDERESHGVKNTWVYSKKDTRDIRTCWWSLVNCWREGSYETLYNVLMNINQLAVGLTAGRSDGSALMVIGDTPTSSCHTKKRHCLHVRNYYMKIYHGPEGTEYCTDLNVL